MTLIRILSGDKDIEYCRNRCGILEEENHQSRKELAAIKETVSVLVARNTRDNKQNSRTESGDASHKILMSIKETYRLRGIEFLRLFFGVSWRNRFKKIDSYKRQN